MISAPSSGLSMVLLGFCHRADYHDNLLEGCRYLFPPWLLCLCIWEQGRCHAGSWEQMGSDLLSCIPPTPLLGEEEDILHFKCI